MSTTLRRVREGYTYAGDTDLEVLTCPVCGVTYGIPSAMQRNAYDKGEGAIQWFCPNGHQLGYHGPSEAQKAREKAENQARWAEQRLKAERDLRAHTERQLAAQKGQTTKARKRAAAALCPCCNRSFVQLRRHMEAKHPDYDPAKPA